MRWRLLLSVLLMGTALAAQALVLGAEDEAGPWGGPDGAGCGNDLVRAAYQAVARGRPRGARSCLWLTAGPALVSMR